VIVAKEFDGLVTSSWDEKNMIDRMIFDVFGNL
jgi:hypothetical protein